jgi:RNA polymerase sigma-70 factor (ECF subfamily)
MPGGGRVRGRATGGVRLRAASLYSRCVISSVAVEELVAAARTMWPGVELDPEIYAAFVGERLGDSASAPGSRERALELYLTCACAAGDAAAIALFERSLFPEVDAAARRARADAAIAGDARQELARSLFTGDRPGVATFRGRGDLRGWMRVTAMHQVLKLMKQRRREVLVDDERFLDALCPPEDPELGHLRGQFRGPLIAAFHRAVASLSDEHRALLRLQLDGITIDQLAAQRGIHRATAARWLAEARRAVRDATGRELAALLGAGTAEAESIIRLASSRLDVSLDRLLG